MKHVNSADLRASIGKVVAQLEQSGEPIILEKHNQPIAAIISLKDFRERFVEKAALEARLALVDQMDALSRTSRDPVSAEQALRALRDDA